MQQVDALRRRYFNAVDLKNVTEEIKDVGGHHPDRLKCQYAKDAEHVAGWESTVDNTRTEEQARRIVRQSLAMC